MARGDLPAKRIRFAQEFLIDGNATRAALRAGYSEHTARDQGYQLCKNPSVASYIKQLEQERAERTKITADRVLTELAKLGFADSRHFFTPDGALIPLQNLPEEVSCAIQSIEVVTKPTGEKDENDYPIVERIHKIRMADKKASLELLAKNLKLLDDRKVIEGTIDHRHRAVSDEAQSVLDELAGRGKRPGDKIPRTH